MHLTVTRQHATRLSTPGILAINGAFECYTLEPAAPIPAGAYKIALAFSPHFQTATPHVLGVPGFSAIEIHWGNYPRDTQGCLLVGETRSPDFIGRSREAFHALMSKLSAAASAGESIAIEYAVPAADQSRAAASAPFAITDPELGL